MKFNIELTQGELAAAIAVLEANKELSHSEMGEDLDGAIKALRKVMPF